MNQENNWKEFSNDISNISKKIKSNFSDEENIEDLKNSLKATVDSLSNSFNELTQIVEDTVKDEEIKEDALNLVKKLSNEMIGIVDTAKEKVSKARSLAMGQREQ